MDFKQFLHDGNEDLLKSNNLNELRKRIFDSVNSFNKNDDDVDDRHELYEILDSIFLNYFLLGELTSNGDFRYLINEYSEYIKNNIPDFEITDKIEESLSIFSFVWDNWLVLTSSLNSMFCNSIDALSDKKKETVNE